MKIFSITLMLLIVMSSCSKTNNLQKIVNKNMKGVNGTVIFLDLSSDKEIVFGSNLVNIRTTPCSTFKIWNTLIGIENSLINSEKDPFYKWDGESRSYPNWNKDLNLQEAFQFSCVPAYQILANRIGTKNMQTWIDKIGYGDKDISSGIDIFWLPRLNKKSIKISPKEQVLLIKKLVNNQLEFTDKSKQILKKIMLVKSTEQGTLYGKTGSGQNIDEIPNNNIGWFVGYVISKNEKYAFACLINGKDITGKNAQELVEKIVIESKLL
ncbi:class D beta-lactamase [bacterium]|nr:class D beta-lactamase [bacterium]